MSSNEMRIWAYRRKLSAIDIWGRQSFAKNSWIVQIKHFVRESKALFIIMSQQIFSYVMIKYCGECRASISGDNQNMARRNIDSREAWCTAAWLQNNDENRRIPLISKWAAEWRYQPWRKPFPPPIPAKYALQTPSSRRDSSIMNGENKWLSNIAMVEMNDSDAIESHFFLSGTYILKMAYIRKHLRAVWYTKSAKHYLKQAELRQEMKAHLL